MVSPSQFGELRVASRQTLGLLAHPASGAPRLPAAPGGFHRTAGIDSRRKSAANSSADLAWARQARYDPATCCNVGAAKTRACAVPDNNVTPTYLVPRLPGTWILGAQIATVSVVEACSSLFNTALGKVDQRADLAWACDGSAQGLRYTGPPNYLRRYPAGRHPGAPADGQPDHSAQRTARPIGGYPRLAH